MSSVKLKTLVSKQVPEFVRADNPDFVAFLEAYYDFIDTNYTENIEGLRDIDTSIDAFAAHIKNELDIYGEENYQYIDKVLLLRKIKEIFTAKGSEAAYKFLFKILFDKPVSISYPWDSVLKASDGKWNRDTTLFIRVTNGDITSIVNARVTLISDTRKILVYVDNVRQVGTNVYEAFIERTYYGDINVGDTLQYGDVRGTVIPTTVGYEVINPGTGYKVGDLIIGTTFANNQTIRQSLKVTEVNAVGGVVSIVTIKFGYDYSDDFFLYTTNEQAVRKSRIAYTPSGFDIPDDSEVKKYSDYGEIINPNYWQDVSVPDYVGTKLQQFYTETDNTQGDITNYTLIKFTIGAVAKYQGYYSSNDGFLSDSIYLQDDKFYQKFSYLITIDERLQDYKSLIRSYLHPAGTILFGEYQIQNSYKSSLSVTNTLNTVVPV